MVVPFHMDMTKDCWNTDRNNVPFSVQLKPAPRFIHPESWPEDPENPGPSGWLLLPWENIPAGGIA
jgi:hypothetical protein